LKRFSREELKEMLGKWGEAIYFKARGIDESLIVEDREVKSIGEQTTFQENTLNSVFISAEFKKLCEGVFESFRKSGFKSFKTVAVTVRFSDFETKTSAKTLKKETGDKKTFRLEALKLLLPFFDRRKNPRQKLIRLIGVRVEKLKN
jgi:nucleotidyltransferase/DNA polymerase involved in DNA repair